MQGIETPGENDCLLGQGNLHNNHLGNIKFRYLLENIKYRETNEFQSVSWKRDKSRIIEQVVKEWKTTLVPPGRFLKQDEDTNLWYEVGNEGASYYYYYMYSFFGALCAEIIQYHPFVK